MAEDWEGTVLWNHAGLGLHQVSSPSLNVRILQKEAMTRFQHEFQKIMDQPQKHAVPVYGANIQYAKDDDKSTKLGK